MRARRVRLVDLGFERDFTRYVSSVSSFLDSVNVDWDDELVDVEIVRTRSIALLDATLTAEADLLHLSGHGTVDDERVSLHSDDEELEYTLDELAEHLCAQGSPIGAPVLIVDACDTAHTRFRRAWRDCIASELVYIGASGTVGWMDSTVWATAFYAAFVRNKGRGTTAGSRAQDAFDRAQESYTSLTDRRSPYRLHVLSPSRTARAAFSGRG